MTTFPGISMAKKYVHGEPNLKMRHFVPSAYVFIIHASLNLFMKLVKTNCTNLYIFSIQD